MKKHALIVEDDGSTAIALERVMKALDFTVSISTTLKQARALVKERLPDLVLLDLALPDGNGLELVVELGDEKRVRIVVITGNRSQEAAIESFRADADDFLAKPVSLSELRNSIEKSMKKQDGLDEQSEAMDHATDPEVNGVVKSLVGKTFWQIERDLLMATLERHNGDKAAAAETLGISLKTLYNRLHAYS